MDRINLSDILDMLTNLTHSLSQAPFPIVFDEEMLALNKLMSLEKTAVSSAFMFEKQLQEEAILQNRLQLIAAHLHSMLNKLSSEIYQELFTIETEMHGIEHYSNYESVRIKNYLIKLSFKEKLEYILTLIENKNVYSNFHEEVGIN